MAKKNGWFQQVASMKKEVAKKRDLGFRLNKVKRAYESLIDAEKEKIMDLEEEVVALQEAIVMTEDKKQSNEQIVEMIKDLNRKLDELEYAKERIEKDLVRKAEALEEAELIGVTEGE